MTDEEMLKAMKFMLEPINQKLGIIDGRMDTLDRRMDTLEGKINTLDGRMDTLEGKINTLDRRMDSVDKRLDMIDGRLDSMDVRLSAVEEGVKKNRREIKSTKLDVLRKTKEYITNSENEVLSELDRFTDRLNTHMEDNLRHVV